MTVRQVLRAGAFRYKPALVGSLVKRKLRWHERKPEEDEFEEEEQRTVRRAVMWDVDNIMRDVESPRRRAPKAQSRLRVWKTGDGARSTAECSRLDD